MGSQRYWQGLDLRCYRLSRCLLIFVFLALPLSATTYYLDCNGSDSNNGTSTSTPWQSISKVNNSSFSPGDSVLFQAGCTWREQLTVPSSGSTGSPITFGAYGSGTVPIISGADLLTSWTQSGSYYYASVSTQPNQVFRDGVRLTQVATPGALSTGTWWWDSTDNRVDVFDNPFGHTIEASQRSYGIYAILRSYLVVNGLTGDKAQTAGLYFNAGTGNVVANSTFQHNCTYGLRLDSPTHATVSTSTAFDNGADGFSFYASPGLLVDGVTAYNNSALTDTNYTAGIKMVGSASTNMTVRNSKSYSNGVGQGGSLSIGAGIWADTVGTGLVIQNNLSYTNNHAGIYIDASSGATVMYNVAYADGLGGLNPSCIIYSADGVAGGNNLFYNNTVYNCQTTGFEMDGANVPNGCNGVVVQNNISSGTTTYELYVHGGCENTGTNNAATYNALGSAATNFIRWGSTNYSTYASWETAYCGSTGCSHSAQGDPKFTNAAGGDFTLQPNSPAINAGTNLGTTYQMGLDPRSSFPWGTLNQNGQGTGWEIGAFVFVQQIPPAPPTSLSVTVQ